MYLIKDKERLTETVSKIVIVAPEITRHAQPGQFVMLRIEPEGERVPMTLSDTDPNAGTITIIFQVVGSTTYGLNQLKTGDYLVDVVGPLGKPSDLKDVAKALIIGGGVGCAIAYPVAKALYQNKAIVHTIIGFRNKEMVFLEKAFQTISHRHMIYTDDGSYGLKGFVTDGLKILLDGESYDRIFAIGPLPMMQTVSKMTKPYHIPTIVSMNPIMVDGTGMCGGCRVSVDNKIQFACVDGPEFDGHKVDFDEAIKRNQMYRDFEQEAYEKRCRLLKEDQT